MESAMGEEKGEVQGEEGEEEGETEEEEERGTVMSCWTMFGENSSSCRDSILSPTDSQSHRSSR